MDVQAFISNMPGMDIITLISAANAPTVLLPSGQPLQQIRDAQWHAVDQLGNVSARSNLPRSHPFDLLHSLGPNGCT